MQWRELPLLFITQKLLEALPEQFRGMALAVIGALWLVLLLALLVYGFRARDQRAQYVALLLFAYAVLLALLAFAASQGAALGSVWLLLLAVGFGVLLAALLLFGWGLRAEGAKTAGLVTLLLTLLVLPLVVTLNTVNLSGSGIIEKITAPSVYGLNSGVLIGCAAPSTAPQTMEQPTEMQEARREAPTAARELQSANGVASATVVVETLKEIAADQDAPAAAEPAAAPASAVEMPTQAPRTAEEAPTPAPNLSPQPEVAAAEVLTLTTTVITRTATPLSPSIALTATQELTAALELATLAISETAGANFAAASPLSTTSAITVARIAETQFLVTETLTPTATVTPTMFSELETRQVLTKSPTATSVPSDLNDITVAAASADIVSPTSESPAATTTLEPVTPSPTPTPEPAAPAAPELTLELPTDTPLPALELTPLPPPTPTPVTTTATPAPEMRVRQLPRPAPVPLEALPIIRERFPQTLYWNPEAVTDAAGRVQVTIPTGDTITSWRISAQAVDRDGKLGSSTLPLVVFQPLFLAPSVPAELSLGQETTAQVQIFNYSSEPQTVVLVSQATSGLQLSPSEQTMTMPANDVVTLAVRVQAVQSGPQSILWMVQSDGLQDARQVKIMVK